MHIVQNIVQRIGEIEGEMVAIAVLLRQNKLTRNFILGWNTPAQHPQKNKQARRSERTLVEACCAVDGTLTAERDRPLH